MPKFASIEKYVKSIQKSIPTAPRRPPLSEVHFTAPPPDYDTACNLNDPAQKSAAKLSSASSNHVCDIGS
uniref:NADH dehydrogenase [ubiquinone] 1 alpha subcomplex subunit 7 n=1 Tax=Ascaris lumbricoides TaxID=6252 RepID=A0A0M3IBC1_ASCLU